MKRKMLFMVFSGLLAFALILISCGQASTEEPTKTSGTVVEEETKQEEGKTEEPKTGGTSEEPSQEENVSSNEPVYGGTLTLANILDVRYFDSFDSHSGDITLDLTNQRLWDGDWAKGIAGGFGSQETDWATSYDIPAHKFGYIAEKTEWSVDAETSIGTIVWTIRQGVHWAYNPDSEASRLVNGREVTADDVLAHLKRVTTELKARIYAANPGLRNADITKTGPWEITANVAMKDLMGALKRLGDSTFIMAPEVIETYGDARNWENSVGTGPFMLTDYVAGSAATLKRNPNYWLTDPVGPGKGNQLPYLDEVRWLIIPDKSTQLAALRTGKIDQMINVTWEEDEQLRQATPELMSKETAQFSGINSAMMYMRTDQEPFNDVRVRRALMMGIDFETIRQELNGGHGQILTFPFTYTKAYSTLYLGLDDPEMPDSVKELYVYNPEKAKELLADAGFPNGFKTTLTLIATETDYFSVIKNDLSKIGIDLELNVVDTGAKTALGNSRDYEGIITYAGFPPSKFPILTRFSGDSSQNTSKIDDPKVDEAVDEIGLLAVTDMIGAMKLTRELMKYFLDQAYVIPNAQVSPFIAWWPWVKNYSGERSLGYFWVQSWPQWIWIDQDMKESMGY